MINHQLSVHDLNRSDGLDPAAASKACFIVLGLLEPCRIRHRDIVAPMLVRALADIDMLERGTG